MLDLQINGFATKDFACNFWQAPDDESINSLNRFLYKEGVKQYLATVITSSLSDFEMNLKRIQEFCSKYGRESLLGVHIEGGLISRLGIHPEQYAKAVQYKEAKLLIKQFPGLIKLWTLCPKLDTGGQITRFAQDHGIVVSYGHSNASYQEALTAFDSYGVKLVTHWGNAMYIMKDFKQRDCSAVDLARLDTEVDGGLGLAAYQRDDVVCMAIAGSYEDGDQHLDPRLLIKLFEKKKDRMILVSDSVCQLEARGSKPEKLIGGLASLGKHAQNAVKIGIPEAEVIKACWKTPREVLHLT